MGQTHMDEAMLERFGLEEQFSVVQADSMTLRCETCGKKVSADVADLHLRGCDA